jgi:hypothetical protein
VQSRTEIAEAKRERGQSAFKSQMQLEEARRQRLDTEMLAVKQAAQQEVFDTLQPVAQADQVARHASAAAAGQIEDADVHYIPAPRSQGSANKIEIAHSERPFPTPLRESRHSAF